MSLGALALVDKADAVGPVFTDEVTLVGDGDYPTGGSTGLLAKFQAARGQHHTIVAAQPYGSGGGDYKCEYNPATDALLVRLISTGAEVAAHTNLSGVTFGLIVTSK